MKKNDTKVIKTATIYKLDQFFTKEDIAVQCVKIKNLWIKGGSARSCLIKYVSDL